mmetsp:Transcript_93649/g.269625  ORF Transcript_93649/g.269625 Transcript_93649/m.269625 type:complete len:1122 (+) Transcript_93649:131-3496(+)
MSLEERSDGDTEEDDDGTRETAGTVEEDGAPNEDGVEDRDPAGGDAGAYNANDVNDQVFEELELGLDVAQLVQDAWNVFIQSAESREAAGEAIYAALFDAAPSLQSLFRTPRAVMAMRFMNGLQTIIQSLKDPKELKIVVETLGFQHLDLEVTIPRVVVFRDAIMDLFAVELGDRCPVAATNGLGTVLNYVGGAFIYIRLTYAERLKTISVSWAGANGRTAVSGDEGEDGAEEAAEAAGGRSGQEQSSGNAAKPQVAASASKKGYSWFSGRQASAGSFGDAERARHSGEVGTGMNTAVPKTFNQMFMFNAAVMGFGTRTWMLEVLNSFDAIVCNVTNSHRFQEECDVLSLRISKYPGTIALGEYKSVMLASLRSLVKDWGSLHEVSWSWLWENVARMLMALMGKPAGQERALSCLLASLDDASLSIIRREVYTKFFALAPTGQDYFKQSTTRLHFIADKVVAMTLEMYKEPKRMVEDISALGLRHVGYGIPTDLFGPFVTACVQVLRLLTQDDKAEEAFRWSLGLISRILTRVINEGSTIVMKAINTNSAKLLKRAVACAPRGQRSLWMLNVQVGTQSISPLMWAIGAGSLEAARAIIQDLLTIRADRDRYYYGMDIMFERHPDIIKRLCADAPALLPVLLDGLVWRSRVVEGGLRRVNYYVRHLIVSNDGRFSKATQWFTENGDPKLVCHPVAALVTDTVWSRVAFSTFLYGKAWFLFTLMVFVLSQSILTRTGNQGEDNANVIFGCRCFIYFLSMGQLLYHHIKYLTADLRNRSFVKFGFVKVPEYVSNSWQDVVSLLLTILLVAMLSIEPLIRCLESGGYKTFTQRCPQGENFIFSYSLMSSGAMILYFLLLCDLSVFSTRVSAFALVCGRVLSELLLFLFAFSFIVVAFACAISALDQQDVRFDGIPSSMLRLYTITLGMFSPDHYDKILDEPALMALIIAFVVVTVVFLYNLLIAQLACAYSASYQDMVGFARLKRGNIVMETMQSVPQRRWEAFVDGLRLDDRVEFGEGDIGLAGGIQVFEPASEHPTTVDLIRRFGGSTSPAARWPDEDLALSGRDDEDRFERMEKMIERAMKRMSAKQKRRGGSSAGGSSMMGSNLNEGSGSDSGFTSGSSQL